MVEIISKRDGPRREDVQARRLIEQNRSVITKLADHLSGGRYSESKKPKLAPQAEGLIIHIGGGPAPSPRPEPEPRVRVTSNGRVIVVDVNSGRQLQHFGNVHEVNGARVFALATTDKGFIAPVDDATRQALADLDGVCLGPFYDGPELAADIGIRLDIRPEA